MSRELFEENLQKIKPLLAKFSAEPIRHFINGESVVAFNGKTFSIHSPVDNSLNGAVSAGTAEDIDIA